eukprot:3941983-Rhodomonas_salina.3
MLRLRYAKSGTDICYQPITLRPHYAVSCTNMAVARYSAYYCLRTRCAIPLRVCYAMPRTEIASTSSL